MKPSGWPSPSPTAPSPWCCRRLSDEEENADAADDEAVDAERPERLCLEEPHQEAHGRVGREAGDDGAHDGLTPHSVAEVTEEVRQLDETGPEDDRRSQQEREAGGVLMVEASGQAGDHGDARAADAGEQGADLRHADGDRLSEVERVET